MITQFFNKLPTGVKRLCANFSGASLKVLDACEQAGADDEYSDYVKLGIVMLLLACLSGASGAYAMFTVSNNGHASVFFGVFWGALILSLDRLIVATWSLASSFWANVLLIGSRFGLSLLIGFLISYPAELAIFRPEINDMLVRERIESALRENAVIENDLTRKAEREALREKEQPLREEVETMRKEVQRLYEEFKAEAEGSGGTGTIGYGQVARQKEERYMEYKSQFNAVEKRDMAQIAAIEDKLEQLDRKKQQQLAEKDTTQEQATGLLARASALHRLMEERPVVAWIKWGITLILILLETLPLMVKLHASLSGKSAYEDIKAQSAEERQQQREIRTTQRRKHLDQLRQNHQAELEALQQAVEQQRALLEHDHQTALQKKELVRQAEAQQFQEEQDLARQQTQAVQTAVVAHVMPRYVQHTKVMMDARLDKWAKDQDAELLANSTQFQQSPIN